MWMIWVFALYIQYICMDIPAVYPHNNDVCCHVLLRACYTYFYRINITIYNPIKCECVCQIKALQYISPGMYLRSFRGINSLLEVVCSPRVLSSSQPIFAMTLYTAADNRVLAYVNLKDNECSTSESYSACNIDKLDSHKTRLVTLVDDLDLGQTRSYGCNITSLRHGQNHVITWSLEVAVGRCYTFAQFLFVCVWAGFARWDRAFMMLLSFLWGLFDRFMATCTFKYSLLEVFCLLSFFLSFCVCVCPRAQPCGSVGFSFLPKDQYINVLSKPTQIHILDTFVSLCVRSCLVLYKCTFAVIIIVSFLYLYRSVYIYIFGHT